MTVSFSETSHKSDIPLKMNQSLPMSSKGNLRESLLMNFKGSPKQSRQSSDTTSYLQAQEPGLSFKTDTQKPTPTTKSVRLSDLMAAMYPGVKVGHQYCVPRSMLVPKTMGWLWNTEDTVVGVPFPRGYRPGAIALGVKKRNIRPRSIIEPLTTPIGFKGKKIKGKRVKTTSSIIPRSQTESLLSVHEKKIPPTLYIHKEKGVYRVTMQPICVPQQVEGEEENPVQFKIADSTSEHSGTSKSSSTIKIEYMCTGARRKPIKKPELAEISTQWDIQDLTKPEPEKKEENKETTEAPKIKEKKTKAPKKDKSKMENTKSEKEKNETSLIDKAVNENVIQEDKLQKEKERTQTKS